MKFSDNLKWFPMNRKRKMFKYGNMTGREIDEQEKRVENIDYDRECIKDWTKEVKAIKLYLETGKRTDFLRYELPHQINTKALKMRLERRYGILEEKVRKHNKELEESKAFQQKLKDIKKAYITSFYSSKDKK